MNEVKALCLVRWMKELTPICYLGPSHFHYVHIISSKQHLVEHNPPHTGSGLWSYLLGVAAEVSVVCLVRVSGYSLYITFQLRAVQLVKLSPFFNWRCQALNLSQVKHVLYQLAVPLVCTGLFLDQHL